MKRRLILALLVMFALADEDIQVNEQDVADICKMKKATFVQNLKLSEEEMEKFWPIYAQYDKEINATIEKRHHLMSKYKEKDLLEIDSETAKMLVEQNNKIERELSEIKISYYEKFLSILPAQKVAKLIKEEKQMMHKIRKKDRQESKPQEQIQKQEGKMVV